MRAIQNCTEMMLPQARAQFAAAVETRADRQPRQKRGMKPRIEKRKTGSQNTGIGLDAADQHSV